MLVGAELGNSVKLKIEEMRPLAVTVTALEPYSEAAEPVAPPLGNVVKALDATPVPVANSEDATPVPVANTEDPTIVPVANAEDPRIVPVANSDDATTVPVANSDDATTVPVANREDVTGAADEPVANSEETSEG